MASPVSSSAKAADDPVTTGFSAENRSQGLLDARFHPKSGLPDFGTLYDARNQKHLISPGMTSRK
jgi:hypothetical protein